MNLPVRRTRENAVIAGVCAGLARRWGIDPNLLRIGLVVIALASGIGVVLYGVGYLMLAGEDDAEPPIHRLLPFTKAWPTRRTAVLLALAGAVLVGLLGGWSGFGVLPVLVALGLWYTVRRGHGGHAAVTADPTPFERAAEAWRVRLVEQQVASGALPAPVLPPAAPAALPVAGYSVAPGAELARRPRRNGRLWWLALGLSAVGTGVVALSQAQGFTTGPLAYLAVVLASLGLTLVVATWRGRPPLIGLATVVVMIATLVTWLVPTTATLQDVRIADEPVAFVGDAVLPPEISATVGDLELDLSGLELKQDTTLAVSLGVGDLTVKLPPGVNAAVTWDVGAGTASLPGGPQDEGLNLSGTQSVSGDPAAPTLTLQVSLKAGTLEVVS